MTTSAHPTTPTESTDYSIYVYYKGPDTVYPNTKAAFFGSYERAFDEGYDGAPEHKAKELAAFVHDLILELASDMSAMGGPGIDAHRGYEFFLNVYQHPDFRTDFWG